MQFSALTEFEELQEEIERTEKRTTKNSQLSEGVREFVTCHSERSEESRRDSSLRSEWHDSEPSRIAGERNPFSYLRFLSPRRVAVATCSNLLCIYSTKKRPRTEVLGRFVYWS